MLIIDELRRKRDLLQAYDLAKERLLKDSNQNLIKKDFSRVLIDLLQKNCKIEKAEHFFSYLDEFNSLKLSSDNSVIYENILWQVGKFIKELTRSNANSSFFNRIYDMIFHIKLPPKSSLFTFITSSALESKKLNESYIRILIYSRISNLSPQHFEAISEDGEKKASLGELMLLCIAKYITTQDPTNDEYVKILLEELNYVGDNYKNIPYIDYYKAKAYHLIGDIKKSIFFILKYLKKRSKDYLGWELLADISNIKEHKIQALCKALICHAHPGELLRPQIKLFHILLQEKEFSVAKVLYQQISLSKRDLGKKISDDWKGISEEKWFKYVNRDIHLLNYCYKTSHPLLSYVFKDLTTYNGIIYDINSPKDIVKFLVSEDVHGSYKYFGDSNLKVGDFVSLKLQRVSNYEGIRFKALYIEKSDQRPKRSIYRVIKDKISFDGTNYFVDNIAVNIDYIISKQMLVGQVVRIKAVKLPSSKFNQFPKWKVISIV